MKILFQNTTQYNKKIYDTFLAFHNKKYHFTYALFTVLVVAFILFSTIVQVSYHNFTLAILLCCALTFFILWRLLHPISEIKKEYKSPKIQEEKSFTFKFYPKYFTVEDEKEINQIFYYKLYKIFETQDFFYLYIDKKYAFLIDKTKFEKGTFANFSLFIKKKCWYCFKKVK